jgi:hypothetical protein
MLNTPSPAKGAAMKPESSQKLSEYQSKIISEQKLQIEKVRTSESRNLDVFNSAPRSLT